MRWITAVDTDTDADTDTETGDKRRAEAIYATQVARGRPGNRGRGRDGWTSDTVKRQETRGVMLQRVRARVRVRVHKQKSESPMRARARAGETETGRTGT